MRVTIVAVVFVLFWALEASAQQRLFAEKCDVPALTRVVCQVLCPVGREAIDGDGIELSGEAAFNAFNVFGDWPIMSGLDFSASQPSGTATGWQAVVENQLDDTQIGVWVECGPDPTEGTCRDADITSDGVVGLPDFTALSACFGKPIDTPLP